MRISGWLFIVFCGLIGGCHKSSPPAGTSSRPNFLLVIADDQSWRHTSRAGDPAVRTPYFDEIARNGVYFSRAYASAPTCTASRSALLSGQHFWRTGGGALLWGEYPRELPTYQYLLQQAGYRVGYAGKGWGPGKNLGTLPNPAGHPYQVPRGGGDPTETVDYVAGLEKMLDELRPDQPFSFIVSAFEPHRPFALGIGRDVDINVVEVPAFLPDTEVVRHDLADYLGAIQRHDKRLGALLDVLRRRALLDNTVIIVTADNGMPFPRAKSNLYDYGVRVPLAMQWPRGFTPIAANDQPVSLTDLAPTLLQLAGVAVPPSMTGHSLMPALRAASTAASRRAVFSGFQRHIGDARTAQQHYPMRAIHTDRFTYIHNFAPQRWPAGDPPRFADIDDQSPSKDQLLAARHDAGMLRFFELATAKRQADELYDLQADPLQLHNLAYDERFVPVLHELRQALFKELQDSHDPLLTAGDGAFAKVRYWAPR